MMLNVLRILILSLIFFGSIRMSHASTSSCASAKDGTACVTNCIAAGMCVNKTCVPQTLRPDGTACSAENFCTSGDQCVAGVCTAGPAVVCPDTDACHKGMCDPNAGCAVIDICVPDLGGAGPDMASPTDLGPAPDDLALIKVNDMCFYDPSVEFYTCNGEDGFYYVPADMGSPDGGNEVPWHVRGSRINDCSIGGVDGTFYGSMLLVAAALLWVRRRARA